eukprot:CAMPEP_0196570944 /NCGR_PEP_ID=MMETSP1081-20130531/1106_1 /TAXON_ID=36882 /ORGANISM="Pyramimonas amylifera, Strain CCMP720" /LENGTH=110 /DNA_ID=CAMNT_0041887655 /DNA_START=307 /DNA_END=636 /DNA_ORIENTATION=-
MIPPLTPDLAGIPTSIIQFPAPLYIPHVIITALTSSTTSEDMIMSALIGCFPWFASTPAIVAHSTAETRVEQAMKYASNPCSTSKLVERILFSSRTFPMRRFWSAVELSD